MRHVCCILVVFLTLVPFGQAENTGIMAIDGNHFMLHGQPYYYAGTNCYYLMVYAADPGLRGYVDEILEEAAEMGLTVVRTWAFNDGAGQWNALQTSPGAYQEFVFQGLDYVLYKADLLGIRVILPLVNNWDDYGGMNQYVEWSPTASEHDDFYTDSSCRQWYKDHVTQVLNRVNTFNGRTYRTDPTVFAWELANEPRQESDSQGNELQAWIEEMSAYVKTLVALHLLTTGSEGYYGPSGPNHNPVNWFSWVGVDYIRNHTSATIDFACFHAFPDYWGLDYADSMLWAQDHIDDADALLGKPVVFEEFGKYRPLAERDDYFQAWYDEIYNAAAAGDSAGGSSFWILYHDDYSDYDNFGVYYPSDTSTCQIIATEAARIQDLIPSPFVGDLNCDSSLNSLDIDPFVLVLTATPPGYAEYYAQHPACDHTLADCNSDGCINSLDIEPFIDLSTSG